MYTILISRGDVEQRVAMKKMLEGELFLEEIPDENGRITKANIWACIEDGAPPVNLLSNLNRVLENHENIFNTKRGVRVPGDAAYDILYQQEEEYWDPLVHPHGATSTPKPNRIPSYDDNGRLQTNDVVEGTNPPISELKSAVNLKKLLATYAAITQYVDDRFTALVNNAPGVMDQMNELAEALGNDPNFSNTINNLISTRKAESIAAAKAYSDTLYEDLLAQINDVKTRYAKHTSQLLTNCTCNTPTI